MTSFLFVTALSSNLQSILLTVNIVAPPRLISRDGLVYLLLCLIHGLTHNPRISQSNFMARKKYALIGAGGRSAMFLQAIFDDYSDIAELVALADVNQARMDFYNRKLQNDKHDPVPTYHAADFDRMIEEQKPAFHLASPTPESRASTAMLSATRSASPSPHLADLGPSPPPP